MVLAALTASGFLVTFHIVRFPDFLRLNWNPSVVFQAHVWLVEIEQLARGSWSVRQISWLMLRIWLSGAFLDESPFSLSSFLARIVVESSED